MCFRLFIRTMEVLFIVCLLLVVALVVWEVRIPGSWLAPLVDAVVPQPWVASVDSLSFCLRSGVTVRGLRVFDRSEPKPDWEIASAKRISFSPIGLKIVADELTYTRLPASYYAPENHERSSLVKGRFPQWPTLKLQLNHPNILAIQPRRVVGEVSFAPTCLSFDRLHLDWPESDEPMDLDGFCRVDLGKQEVVGEVEGSALQRHIRPFLVAIDIPVALPYMDAFTGVRGKVPARCSWQVNLVNNDFDLQLDLHPRLGQYKGVELSHADGRLDLHVYTRGNSLNYHHTIGPIASARADGKPLAGTVMIDGINGTNTVSVTATSELPVSDLLKIGGFTDTYVDSTVCGHATCDLRFVFPRAMTNNYEVLNGQGRLSIRDGQIMRLKGFQGLVELMAEKVPGVSWFTDSTQASCDYVIRNGVLSSENIYIEGTVFSIKMSGSFDTVRDKLDFLVHVQLTKKDSLMAKVLHPLTWPFTKLLMEFRLTGSATDSQWEYVSVLDRVMEAVP